MFQFCELCLNDQGCIFYEVLEYHIQAHMMLESQDDNIIVPRTQAVSGRRAWVQG